jgi:hypothetical protein
MCKKEKNTEYESPKKCYYARNQKTGQGHTYGANGCAVDKKRKLFL